MIALLLAAATSALYWPVLRHGFINYDDERYVTRNVAIQRAPALQGLAWAFTTTQAANWHPLTWWSHILDCRLYGLHASGHHLTSLLLHAANAALLFLVLRQMTRRWWPSAFVAALFALHPLQVESVAWIAERKNLLSTLFFLLTLWAYGRYVEVQSPKLPCRFHVSRFYLLSLFFFALGLMSKPMLVTLPFVLLLLDYWPLGRATSDGCQVTGVSGASTKPRDEQPCLAVWLRLCREKAPFFVLSALSCGVTVWAQGKGGAIANFADLPMAVRLQNAIVSYARYLGKLLWPSDLAVYYPHPGGWPWPHVAAAALLVGGVSWAAFRLARRAGYVPVGWLWFLGTLVPVIGLVQVGGQSIADRYAYVPAIGLFILVAWSVEITVARWPRCKPWIRVAALLVLAACAIRTREQLQYWQNSEKLFAHTLAVTGENYVAYDRLGNALCEQGRLEAATGHLLRALQLRPGDALAHHNLGYALLANGRVAEAITQFQEALEIRPDYAKAHSNLGLALRRQGQPQDALAHFEKAVALQPDLAEAHGNLGIALLETGRVDEAAAHLRRALELGARDAAVHNQLGKALFQRRQVQEAIQHFQIALQSQPDLAEAHNNLGLALAEQGQLQNAIAHFQKALEIRPDYAEAHNNFGVALRHQGRWADATAHFQKALALRPDFADAHSNLGIALFDRRREEAIEHLRKAVELQPGNAEVQNNLGYALLASGRAQEAIRHLEKALEIRPDHAQARKNLALAQQEQRSPQ